MFGPPAQKLQQVLLGWVLFLVNFFLKKYIHVNHQLLFQRLRRDQTLTKSE